MEKRINRVTAREKWQSYLHHPMALVQFLLVHLAALITAAVVLFLIAYVLIMAVHPFLEIVLLGMFLYSFTSFLSISACYPLVDQYLVKPIEELQKAQEAEQKSDDETDDDDHDDQSTAGEKPVEKAEIPAIRDTNLF